MAKLKVAKPIAEGADRAAARVGEAAKASTARVTERAQGLGDFLRDQRRGARLTLRQLADQAGVSNPYLSQIERGLRKPSADVLQQLAKALRISAETLYIRAGILEPHEHDGDSVQAAVLSDPALTERQRQVLLDIYNSFRRENGAVSQDDDPTTHEWHDTRGMQ
jgi:transcriptional regulator with XRE-family HTH domain